MINGDDLYNSYAKISYVKSPLAVWIFSKIYFYIFIALFIYVVLSLFIGIIADTYERLKVCGLYSAHIMHLSLETPTPGRRGAYVGICKCLDDLPAPMGWGNSSL